MCNQKTSKKSNYIVYITDIKYSETEEYKKPLKNPKHINYTINPFVLCNQH